MKRKRTILTTITILMLLASVAGAHGYYRSFGSLRSRAYWSIHVHDLVPDSVYYSPYALSWKHISGLITRDGKPYRPDRTNRRIINIVGYSPGIRPSCTQSQVPDYKEMTERRERMVRALKNEREKINAENKKYRKKIAAISNFLKSQNTGNFEIMYGRVSVAGKRDAYFISRDSDNLPRMVIRYSETESSHPYYEEYERKWQAFQDSCRNMIQVYAIKAADEEGIKAQLQKLFDS